MHHLYHYTHTTLSYLRNNVLAFEPGWVIASVSNAHLPSLPRQPATQTAPASVVARPTTAKAQRTPASVPEKAWVHIAWRRLQCFHPVYTRVADLSFNHPVMLLTGIIDPCSQNRDMTFSINIASLTPLSFVPLALARVPDPCKLL